MNEPYEAPEEHDFDYGIIVAMFGLLGEDLVSALELDDENQSLIYEWESAFANADESHEGAEALERVLDQMWARVQMIEERGLNPDQLAALAYAVHAWEQSAQDNNPAPFGEFDEQPLD